MAIEKNVIKKDLKSNFNNLKKRILSGNYKIYLGANSLSTIPNDRFDLSSFKAGAYELTKELDIANIDLNFREITKIHKPFGSLYEVAISIPAGIDISLSTYKNGAELQVLMTDLYMLKNGGNLLQVEGIKSPYNPFTKEVHSDEKKNNNRDNQKTLGTTIFNNEIIKETISAIYHQPLFELLIEIIHSNLESEVYLFPNVSLFNYRQNTKENLDFISESISIHAPSVVRLAEPSNYLSNLVANLTNDMLREDDVTINNYRVINPNNKDLYDK